MRVRDDYRSLSGPEKAAILILSLSEEQSSKLFGMMDDEEILELSQIISTLGRISPGVIERLFIDFAEQMSSTNAVVGSHDSTERLLLKSGMNQDKIDSIMEEIRGPAGRTMWEKLGNVNEEVLANFLQKEYPQTVAVVLSKISTDHAARVLGQFPDSFAIEVIQRMLRMETVQKEILDEVEKTLRKEFMSNLARTQRRDSHEVVAEIFNSLERSVESRFMEELERMVPDSAEKIRSLMFTFEDLGKLDPASVQTLIRAADKEKLPTALKGATETMRDLFFSNMSERAAKIMKEDMAAMGPVRLKDVEEAQQYIVNVAKDLEARGEIVIASGSTEDEMIF
ncbi:MAG: flagellar motor switch protein FliG [Alphaproteobacteria bacterium]|nr:flagellar motor switch protein FliG [Alphaproteobacteria bacterium]MBK9585408.1 flagellar motor switch protein FliG [Alphaproteobacteria bacterium]MBP7758437.1 flagellar motor switch protein FliG [Alphaproteobacteria bacterium]MBP7762718.1 flagellar motor switch protein FliG [Alphaproteobacteria bacterium]MBP7904408.1 flagellar motor switch protein FliG [Alphaproteobacteria bacterium]